MRDAMCSSDAIKHEKFDSSYPITEDVHASDDIWRKKEFEIFGANLSEDLIEDFREALKNKGHSIQESKNTCAMFLRGGSLNVELALKLLQTYLQNKSNCRQYFVKDAIPYVRTILEKRIHTVAPYRDSEGRRVFIIRPGLWETDKLNLSDLYCVSAMIFDLIATEPKTQIAGAIVIFDGEGFGYSQLRCIGIQDAKNIADFMNCFPVWFRGIHIVHQPFVFNMAYNLVYPFLNENARKVLHCHGKDMKSLHSFVDSRILPFEYGGSGGRFDNKEVTGTLCDLEKYFQDLKSWKL